MRPFSFKLLVELKADARAAWNNAGALEVILDELNHRKTFGAKRFQEEIEARLRELKSSTKLPKPSLGTAGTIKAAASKKGTASPSPPSSAPDKVRPPKLAPEDQALRRLKPISVRDFCIVDAPGLNSVSIYCPEEEATESAVVTSSRLPNVPSCIILPALPRDPLVAGDEALRCREGIGDSWPPDAFIRLRRATVTAVPDRRLLVARCWDALISPTAANPKTGAAPMDPPRAGPLSFDWERVDEAGGRGQLSASDGIAQEVLAVARRHGSDQPGHFVVLIPDCLDDVSQQALLNSLCRALGTSSQSVRLLWRSIAYALEWLDRLADDAPFPECLYVLEAQPSGLALRQFAVRAFNVGKKRVLCPVRRSEAVSPQRMDSLEGLFQLAVGQSTSPDATVAWRDLHLGRVAFFDPEISEPLERQDLESVPSRACFQFRYPQEPRKPQLGKLATELTKIAKQVPDGATLLVLGVVAKEVSQALTAQGIQHHLCAPQHGVHGGAVFMRRARKGLPTYLDELPRLDLFVLKHRHRHWESLIPDGTEIFGQQEYVHTLPAFVSISRGSQALNSYLRRGGHASLRHLETKLPQPPQEDELCDLKITASSAGGLAVIEAVPTRNRRIFGERDTLQLDWDSMQEALPEPDGWPKVSYSHGYPKCGEIFSSQGLFQNLLAQLRDLSSQCARRNWAAADDLIGRMLVGTVRTSIPIRKARQEIQQMAPIGSVRPAGTTAPANFLDTDLPVDRCVHSAPMHLHEPMLSVVSELKQVYIELVSGSGRANNSTRHVADRLFKVLTWLGGYFPVDLMPRLREDTEESANSENLTALGRCARSPEDAALLLRLLVADKLTYRANGSGTTNYLKCFIYLSFQHEAILRTCDRDQLRLLIEHATLLLQEAILRKNFKTTFVMALRTIALALRFRQFVTSEPQFMLYERHAQKSNSLTPEARLASKVMATLTEALETLRNSSPRLRNGRLSDGATIRKMQLVCRVRQWLEWKALTDTWGLPPADSSDEDGDGDNSE